MNELIPLILLFLFGGLAVVTAALKARARVTSPVAVVFALLEAVSGVALMVVAFPGSENLAAASRMGMVAGVMVALSSTIHLMQVRARSRANEESEGHRLHLAVKYGVGRGKVYGEPLSDIDIDVDTNRDVQGDPGEGGVTPSRD